MPCIARPPDPLVLRGTLTTFRRRCGKPTCHSATGELHESPALTFTEDGRSKTLTLRPEEVGEVEEALTRYEATRAELDRSARIGLATLRARRGGGAR